MKTVNIVPSLCKGKAAKWEGSVTLRLPTFDERYEYIEALNVKATEDGTVESMPLSSQLASIREMVKLSQKHYVSIDLKNKETLEEIKSFDDMQYIEDLHVVMIEVATMIIKGFKVGNG